MRRPVPSPTSGLRIAHHAPHRSCAGCVFWSSSIAKSSGLCFALHHLVVRIAQITKRENLGRTRLLAGCLDRCARGRFSRSAAIRSSAMRCTQ